MTINKRLTQNWENMDMALECSSGNNSMLSISNSEFNTLLKEVMKTNPQAPGIAPGGLHV